MRRRIHVKLNEDEQAQLEFITGALRVRPEDFLRSVLPVHYQELKRLLEQQTKEHADAQA